MQVRQINLKWSINSTIYIYENISVTIYMFRYECYNKFINNKCDWKANYLTAGKTSWNNALKQNKNKTYPNMRIRQINLKRNINVKYRSNTYYNY